jgi:trans-aconitate methyltransferase
MMAFVTADRAEHWNTAYQQGETTHSWFQDEPTHSLRMIDAAGVRVEDGVIDVGGGASRLVDALRERGCADVTVLDVSATPLQTAQHRLGTAADHVTWICHDLLTWAPERRYMVWHDRAVFHFLTDPADRARYLHTLTAATAPGSIAVVGCFDLDGPEQCSGLSVARHSAAGIAERFGSDWLLVYRDREEHITPSGGVQPFTWAVLRRQR